MVLVPSAFWPLSLQGSGLPLAPLGTTLITELAKYYLSHPVHQQDGSGSPSSHSLPPPQYSDPSLLQLHLPRVEIPQEEGGGGQLKSAGEQPLCCFCLKFKRVSDLGCSQGKGFPWGRVTKTLG